MHRPGITKIVLTAVSVFGICIYAFAGGAAGDEQTLSLQVATCVDKPVPTLAFIAKNTGTRPIETTPICTNNNRLVVRRPTGDIQEEFWSVDPIEPVVIAGGESTVWYVNNLSEKIRMKEDGVYGIRWKVGETISEEILLLNGKSVGAKEGDQSLILKIATCVDKPGLTFAFIATNRGSQPIESTPIGTNYNRFIVRHPTGEVVEEFVWKSWPRGFVPVLIAPGETTVWYVDNLSKRIRMKEDGVYGIRWKVGDTISNEVLLLKGESVGAKKAAP